MKTLIRKSLALVSLAAFALQAQASLIDFGTYTKDSSTGLDWLDMSFTDGLSYNQVSTAIAGGSLNGWRFATSSEFDGLINSAVGAPYVAIHSDTAILTQMQALVSLLGSTYDDGNAGSTYAYTVGYVDSTSLASAHARQFGYHVPGGYVRPASDPSWDNSKTYVSTFQGSFLVRSATVPDAGSTALLLGIALLGIAYRKRR